MKCQFLDKRLNELTMMVLMRQTESCNMLVHMVRTDKKLLVVETETADTLADDVGTVFCSTDVGRSKQVGQKFVHSSIEPRWHDIHVDRDMHEVDRRSVDKRLNELTMMVLMRQTVSCDMLVHMVMFDMKLLVVETKTADTLADDVDTVLDSYPSIINCCLLARIRRYSELILGCGITRSNNRSQERHHTLLVVETETADTLADEVDIVFCSTDVG
nr:hypothetical protein [Tanacetum cinerariifolium]